MTDDDDKEYAPIPELRSKVGELSLISVLPHNIMYLQESTDPTFYANYRVHTDDLSGWPADVWIRLPPIAFILACVDTNEVCLSDSKTCRNLKYFVLTDVPPWKDLADDPAFQLLLWVMARRTMIDAMSVMLAQAFEAQWNLAQQQLTAVENGNWLYKAERLFQIFLATLQNRVVDVATGVLATTKE